MIMKVKNFIGMLLIGAVLVVGNSSVVYAEQVLPDLNRKDCSISISPQSVDNHEIVKNTQFTAWRIGEAKLQEGMLRYVFTEEFAESGGDLSNLKADGLIEKLENYAISNNVQGITQKADSSGMVCFQNLPTGLYLLKQDVIAEGYEAVSSFFVTVPIENLSGGEWVYNVDASPKAEFMKPEEPTPDPDPSLPQTGQLNWPIPILAAVGIGFFALGFALCSKKR